MQYRLKYQVIATTETFPHVEKAMKRFGLEVAVRGGVSEVILDQTHPRRAEVERALKGIVGDAIFSTLVPDFEPWEVEQAELLHLFMWGLCGAAFDHWAEEVGAPPGSLIMDKREMKKQDIALTTRWQVVVSKRLKSILEEEALTGWAANPIQHKDPENDVYPALYHFTATNVLPPLAPETRFEVTEYWDPKDGLFGTRGLFQRSPLYYARGDLTRILDFNHTKEEFGEAPVAQPYLLLSQRAWRVFLKHRIRGVDVEPLVILEQDKRLERDAPAPKKRLASRSPAKRAQTRPPRPSRRRRTS